MLGVVNLQVGRLVRTSIVFAEISPSTPLRGFTDSDVLDYLLAVVLVSLGIFRVVGRTTLDSKISALGF